MDSPHRRILEKEKSKEKAFETIFPLKLFSIEYNSIGV